MVRSVQRWLPYLALVPAVVVCGCKATTGGATRGHPTYQYVDPGFKPDKSVRVAVLGFVNTTMQADAVSYFYPYLEDALRIAKPSYVLVSNWAVERDARRKNVDEQYEQLNQQWRDSRTFDAALLESFCEGFGCDYVLGGELAEWSSTKVEWQVEGYSHSDVEAAIKMFDPQSGALVWEARDRLQMKSAHYDPSASAGRVDDSGIVRGQAQLVPEPPAIEEVAERVAANLVSVLP